MFTKRHEQELSEIKALTHDLNRRFQEIVEQLGRIQEAQDQLAAGRSPAAPSTPPPHPAGVLDGEAAGAKPGGKKARRRQATPDAITGGKPAKQRTKARDGGAGKRPAAGGRPEALPADPP
jgi:hypothetical protein